MTKCVFEIDPTDPTKVRCVRGGCGRRMHLVPGLALDRYRADCGGGGPGLARRAANFTRAAARDVAAGRPRRTDDEVQAILAICQSCSLYRAGKCTHKDCGCDVKRKAPWKMEHCPVGLW